MGKVTVILYNPGTGNAATGISDGFGGFTYKFTFVSPGYTLVRIADAQSRHFEEFLERQ